MGWGKIKEKAKNAIKKAGQSFVQEAFNRQGEGIQYLQNAYRSTFDILKPKTEKIVDSLSPHTPDNVDAEANSSTLFIGSDKKGNIYNGSSKVDMFWGNIGENKFAGKGSGDVFFIDRKASKTEIKESLQHNGTDVGACAAGIAFGDTSFKRISPNSLRMDIAATATAAASYADFIGTNEGGDAGKGKANESWFGVERIDYYNAQGQVTRSVTHKEIDEILRRQEQAAIVEDDDDPLASLGAPNQNSASVNSQAQLLNQAASGAPSSAPIASNSNTSIFNAAAAILAPPTV